MKGDLPLGGFFAFFKGGKSQVTAHGIRKDPADSAHRTHTECGDSDPLLPRPGDEF